MINAGRCWRLENTLFATDTETATVTVREALRVQSIRESVPWSTAIPKLVQSVIPDGPTFPCPSGIKNKAMSAWSLTRHIP